MNNKVKFDGTEYDLSEMSELAKRQLDSLRFTTARLDELRNLQALLVRAKNSYVETLKAEVISKKSGLILDDD